MRKKLSWVLMVAALLLSGFITYDFMRDSSNEQPALTGKVGTASESNKPKLKDPSEDSMSPSLIAKAQVKLQALGYYHGEVDGQWSRDLNRAVKSFQKAQGLRVTGGLNGRTRARLDI